MPRKGENIFKRKDRHWERRYIKGRSAQGRAVYGYVYAKIYADVKKKLCNAIAAQCNYVQHTMQRTQLEGDKDKNRCSYDYAEERLLHSGDSNSGKSFEYHEGAFFFPTRLCIERIREIY